MTGKSLPHQAVRGREQRRRRGGPRSRRAAEVRPRGRRAEEGAALRRTWAERREGGAPGRGADLRRHGGAGGGPTKVRGAVAREAKRSARGTAGAERAAYVLVVTTRRSAARTARGAPACSRVAQRCRNRGAREDVGEQILELPAMLVRRRREPPHQRARPGAWVGAAGPCDAKRRRASCARRARGRSCGCERRLRSGRGEGETRCVHAAPTRRRAPRIRVARWTAANPKLVRLRLGYAARPIYTRFAAPLFRARTARARGSARSHAASGPCLHEPHLRRPSRRGSTRRRSGVRTSQSHATHATCGAGSRGATVAGEHDRIPFREPCNRRDAAAGGRVNLATHVRLTRAGAAARPLLAQRKRVAQLVFCSGRDAARVRGWRRSMTRSRVAFVSFARRSRVLGIAVEFMWHAPVHRVIIGMRSPVIWTSNGSRSRVVCYAVACGWIEANRRARW